MPYFVSWNVGGSCVRGLVETAGEAQARASWAEGQGGLSQVTVEEVRPCLEHVRVLIEEHDLTYEMSDDHGVWLRGNASLARIRRMIDALGSEKRSECTALWNEIFAQKMGSEFAHQFMWREKAL